MTNTSETSPTRALSLPLGFTGLGILAYLVLSIQRPSWFDAQVRTYTIAAIWLCLGIAVVRAACYVLLEVIFRRRKGREAPALLRMVILLVGYSTLFVIIYTIVLKKNLTGVWTTSAVLSVILGLALQDTLGNFFAGIALHIEQPFQIGDALRVADMVGRVESATWRTTALRTNNNSLIVLPNSKIAREAVEIYHLNSLNRCVLRFPAPYSVPPERVFALVREAVRSVAHVSSEKAPEVRVVEFGDSSISYEVLYWVNDYLLQRSTDAAIRARIWYVFGRNGIEIPFPIRRLFVERRSSLSEPVDDDYDALLSGIDLLTPLSPSERASVAKSVVRQVYAPGEMVLHRGDAGDSMFVIRRGKVEVQLCGEDGGDTRDVAVLGPGGFFGEMGLFTGEPRTADVRALVELELLEIRKPAIEILLDENQQLAESFSSVIAERQAQLTSLSRIVPEKEKLMRRESILQRIQRFFGLRLIPL